MNEGCGKSDEEDRKQGAGPFWDALKLGKESREG